MKKRIKNNKYQVLMILGIFLIFIGLLKIVYNHYTEKSQIAIEEKNIEEFFKEEIIENNIEIPIVEESNEEKEEEFIPYIAILEIPKINLKKGLVDKNSYQNDVDRNIYTLKETIYPNDEVNSHIILASHSGNSNVSYFRKLNYLNINDTVYFYYKGTKYIYNIIDKYEIEKNGKIKLKQTNQSDITLISCVGLHNQVVIIGTLDHKELY